MRSVFALIIATAGIVAIAGCQTPATTSKEMPLVTAAPADTIVSISVAVAATPDSIVPTPQQSAVEPSATLRTVFHGTQEFALEDISGKVVEALTASSYTYVAVEKDNQRIWVATPRSKVTVGDQVAFQPGEVKRNYHSKKLDRTFPTLVFSRDLVNK